MKLLAILLVPFILFSQEMLTRTQILMGTYVSITLPSNKNASISQSFMLVQDIEHSLSSYNAHLVAQLNDKHTVPYDPTLAQALNLSKSYYKDTGNYFDITIGSISKALYHFGKDKTYSPDKTQLHAAKIDMKGIHISQTNITSDEGIVIDLGGMGKGYAVDKVAKYLEEKNITKGVIALSGDIQCLHPCELFLQSPFSENTFAKIESRINNLSISTSGTYRRYATKKSEHHLINPKTASQGKAFVSVSLFAKGDNSKIDAYATAVSVMPKGKALTFLKTHKEIGYVLVEPDGNIIFGNLDNFLNIVWQESTL